jgi:CubicO group peptidase (beta-lactamase class C family)
MSQRARLGFVAAFFAVAGCITPPPPPPPPIQVVVVPAPRAPVAAADARWPTERVRALADSVRRVLTTASADSAFPGAYAIVGTSRGILVRDSAGRIDWASDAPVPNSKTLWDLASVTKVVGVTSALAQLVASGRVQLSDPVQKHLPEFVGANKEQITVRHLITHTGGMPSWRPLHKEAVSADSAVALVMITALDTLPGSRMVYSDLGLIVLGKLVERVSGKSLDRYLADHVFGPAGMRETMYRPAESLRPRIAPTEIDPWRQRHLRGEVHDENAFALGGVAGHAGLFSTADDLARFARMYLNHGTIDGARVLDSATIDLFTTWADSARHNRAIGWMKPSPPGWFGGSKMSAHAFGHTGFTGTSLYIDPDRDVFVLLLTNRVNPTRMNSKIGRVRNGLADAVMSVVIPSPSANAP